MRSMANIFNDTKVKKVKKGAKTLEKVVFEK